MNSFMIEAGRKRRATVTLEEQPGAHTGASRKYIPGYSDSNIVFLNTSTGNDANTGASIAQAVLTYAQAATLAGSTKKIRLVNSATLSDNINKPTEATIGTTSAIQSSSLTASISSISAAAVHGWTSGKPERVTWSPKLKKYYAIGSTEIISSLDGSTWFLEETLSGVSAYSIFWDDTTSRLYVGCNARTLLYSTDGSNYSTITISGGSPGTTIIGAITYSDTLALYVLSMGRILFSSQDGLTWSLIEDVNSINQMTAGIWANGRFFFTTDKGGLLVSANGAVWTFTIPFDTSGGVRALSYMENVGLVIAADYNGEIWSSTNGATWASRRAATTSQCTEAIYIHEIEACVVYELKECAYSTDGITWTSGVSLSGVFGVSDSILSAAYSPLLGRVAMIGGDSGGTTRLNAISPAYATEVTAAVAGFSIRAVLYGGSPTAYNCTMRAPVTTANLSTDCCRFTENGAHIYSNTQTHKGLLVEGDVQFTSTPAAQNAFSLTRYTVAGRIYIHNASATYFEEIKDGIVTDGIQADYSVVVESGNVRGTCTNVIYGLGISVADPSFVDTTDYQLKREVNGYDEDSVCVEKSAYYYNSIGDRRDVGAWSYREENENYIYERAYEMRKPSAKDSTSHNEKIQTSLYWGEDMTPDVAVDPEARGEELTLNYRTLPVADVEFVRYLRTLKDPTVRIDYDPDFAAASTVTVNGNQSAGVDVLVLLTSALEAGQKLTISGKTYYVMRMNGTTKAVLNKPLEDSVTDTQVLTVSDSAGKGVYQFVPQTEMNLTRFYENSRAYFKGVILKFVRKAA